MRWLSSLLFSLCLTLTACAGVPEPCRFAVISDVHLLSPNLMSSGNSDLAKLDATDMRFLALSDEIMGTVCDSLIACRTDAVLVTGDLTKDGERVSHERMAQHLMRLREAGIMVLVIPGNHDISNPGARDYSTAATRAAATVTRKEFAEIYAPYGYGTAAVRRDAASLSYAVDTQGLTIIALDTNRDEENTLVSRGDTRDSYHNAGRVKATTLQWAAEETKKARAANRHVIVLAHHHLLPHFDAEPKLMPNYIVENYQAVCDTLASAGASVICTGHLHIGDIATYSVGGKRLTEIATGSLVTYPFAWRTFTIADDDIQVTTRRLASTPSCPDLQQRGKALTERLAPAFADVLARRLWTKLEPLMPKISRFALPDAELPKSAAELSTMIRRDFGDLATKAVIAVVEGDESQTNVAETVLDEIQTRATAMFARWLTPQGQELAEFVAEEAMPQVEQHIRSILADVNEAGTPQETTTPDNKATIPLSF